MNEVMASLIGVIFQKMQSVLTLHPRGDMTSSWWAAAAAMAAVTFFTVGGNAAVLVALKRVNRAPAHYPLASLATADLLLGLLVLPIAAARELFVFHLSKFFFKSVHTSSTKTFEIVM